jgi:hypothetical protein
VLLLQVIDPYERTFLQAYPTIFGEEVRRARHAHVVVTLLPLQRGGLTNVTGWLVGCDASYQELKESGVANHVMLLLFAGGKQTRQVLMDVVGANVPAPDDFGT